MNCFSGAVTLCEVVGAEAAKLLSSKLMRDGVPFSDSIYAMRSD